MVAVVIPFHLTGLFVGWLQWKAFPWISKKTQPAWGLAHDLALRAGNAVLGFDPDKEPR